MTNLMASLLIFIFLLSGCNKPDPNPHLSDYIYKDIQNKLTEAEKLKATHVQNFEEFQTKLISVDRQSREYSILKRKSFAAKWESEKIQQKIDYYKILVSERENYVKKLYLKYFLKGETWDNSEELRLYKRSADWEFRLLQATKRTKDKKIEDKPKTNNE
jgi:hypothetical protein